MISGRPLHAALEGADRRGRGRRIALGLAGLALLALGLAIGSRIASRDPAASKPITVTVIAPSAGKQLAPALKPKPALGAQLGYPPTRQGAVAAASAYVAALEGPALLEGSRLRSVVRSLAASSVRAQLEAAYLQAAAQARVRLGLGTIPAPVVIDRAAPLGYRVEAFDPGAATILVWRVGIVGSGATTELEQSWRTESVSLVWERGDWKVAGLASEAGPTPPLATTAVSTPGELFASIPGFQEYARVEP